MSTPVDIYNPSTMPPYGDIKYESAKPFGLAVMGATIALVIVIFFLVFLVSKTRRIGDDSPTDVEASPPRPRPQRTSRVPRANLFPLSLPSLFSRQSVRTSQTQDTELANLRPATLTAPPSDVTCPSPTSNRSSQDSQITASATQTRPTSFIDNEVALNLPLPPPPSFQEMNLRSDPVHSVSGQSWVTEGFVDEDLEAPRRARVVRIGRRARGGVMRFAARGTGGTDKTGEGATRRL